MKDLDIVKILKDNIFFNDRVLDINNYYAKNIKIFDKTFDNKEKINLFINPDKINAEILLLITMTIKIYIKNLMDEKNNILNCTKKGDIVILKGKKVKFLGIEEKDNGLKIKLLYKDNDKHWIDVKDGYKLSLYTGDSESLNTMSSKKSKKINNKYILPKLLGIELESLNSVINEPMIVVYPNKKQLEELLENIKIKINNKKYSFTHIFPCRYYRDVDNYINFPGNKLRLKEILIFTCNLNVAIDIARRNKQIENLLLLGQDTYINEIGGKLDNLLKRRSLKKIYLLNIFNKCSELNHLIEKDYDIQLNAWTRGVFSQQLKEIDLYKINSREIKSFLNRKIDNKLVDESIEVSKNLLILRKKIFDLLKDDFLCNDKEKLLRITYGLLNLFEKIVVPIKEYDEFIKVNDLNNYTMEKLINTLNYVLEENKIYENSYKTIKNIVDLVSNIYEFLYYDNPKLQVIKKLKLGYNDLVICHNFIEQKILKEYKFIKDTLVNVRSIKEYKFTDIFKNIVFTCIYQYRNFDQAYCHNGLNIINLLYSSEAFKYNGKVKKFNELSKMIDRNNKLGSSDDIELLKKVSVNYKKIVQDNIIDDKYEEKINTEIENNIVLSTNEKFFTSNLDLDDELKIEEFINLSLEEETYNVNSNYCGGYVNKYIEFKSGNGVLLTQNYKSKCLDIKSNNILEKGNNSLSIGDKLIFVYKNTEDDISQLFNKVIYSDKFKNKFYRCYYNMNYWKEVLKKYIQAYSEDYELVATELLIYGIDKTEQAVRNWVLDRNIIGPREKQIYEALAKITKDKYFVDNWKQIYESCNIIRKFKTKLKKNFNEMVIKSVINKRSDGSFENLVYDISRGLKQYAQIEEIKDIKNISLNNIPTNKTNCILNKNDISEFY